MEINEDRIHPLIGGILVVLKENESTQRYMNLSDSYHWLQKLGAFHEVSKEESVMEEKQYYKIIWMFLHQHYCHNCFDDR